MSGIHDMNRVIELMNQLSVKSTVIINKYDLSLENTKYIEKYCAERGIAILGKIPYDSITTESMISTKTFPEYAPNHPITITLKEMWKKILTMI